MADITKCKGTNCDLALTCYRYTAPKGYIQSYFIEVPLKDGKCDMYWGDKNDQIMDQLIEILNSEEGKDE